MMVNVLHMLLRLLPRIRDSRSLSTFILKLLLDVQEGNYIYKNALVCLKKVAPNATVNWKRLMLNIYERNPFLKLA